MDMKILISCFDWRLSLLNVRKLAILVQLFRLCPIYFIDKNNLLQKMDSYYKQRSRDRSSTASDDCDKSPSGKDTDNSKCS